MEPKQALAKQSSFRSRYMDRVPFYDPPARIVIDDLIQHFGSNKLNSNLDELKQRLDKFGGDSVIGSLSMRELEIEQ